MTPTTKTNRGPSAAPENRAALIAAGREVFEEGGIDAPFSAVAKRAGVGQGSLYRHFPDRMALALAVFDENMTEIEALAARDESTMRDLIDLVSHLMEGIAAMIKLFASSTHAQEAQVLEDRLRAAFATKWDAAHRDGVLGPTATLDDLMMAIAMVSAVVSHAPRERRHEVSEAAWAMLQRGLAS